jgi:hypothetical protein
MSPDHGMQRRNFCPGGAVFLGFARTDGQEAPQKKGGFRPLFDGVLLTGWKPQARLLAKLSLGSRVRRAMIQRPFWRRSDAPGTLRSKCMTTTREWAPTGGVRVAYAGGGTFPSGGWRVRL